MKRILTGDEQVLASKGGKMKRILTGDRPTGRLHLGHFVGSLDSRVKLQNEYQVFVMIADIQALTDNFDDPQKVTSNIVEVALDYLSVGIDPNKSTIFIQSQIPQIAELTVLFMNLVNLGKLLRNPTVKDEIKQKNFGDEVPVGFVNYPISQAADILAFKADLVPVGDDQKPMIELTRDIASRFNQIYGNLFSLPEILVGDTPRLVGIDGGSKMSKSLNNAIYLSDSETEVIEKVQRMYTDPHRIKVTDPGTVEGNPLFIYLDAFGEELDKIENYKNAYRKGQIADIEVKSYLSDVINQFLEPIRQRRQKYQDNKKRHTGNFKYWY